MCAISDILNERGILPPLAYKQVCLGLKQKTGFKTAGKSKWEPTMVRRILLDERYTGVLLQGKRTTPNHKVKKVIYKAEEEWVRVENAFAALIDLHVYEVVVHLLGRDTRRAADGIALLGGLVECADCHQSMVRKSPDKKHYYYICSTSLYDKECASHSFSEKKLIAIVKESIRYYVSVIVSLEKVLTYVKNTSLPEQRIFEADQQLKTLERECNRIMQIKKNLYESYYEGLLNDEEFKSYKKSYDEDLKQKEAAIKKQRESISDMLSMMDKQREWMKHFLVFKDMEEIDRIMVAMLVKRICIHSDKSVSIEFWFEDEFERLIAFLETANRIEPNSVLASFFAQKKGGVQSA